MASPKVGGTKRGKKGLKKLPGWITASLGAEMIGVSRQYMWDLINDEKIDAYEVEGTGTRAAFTIVRRATVDKLARERKARLGCPECRKVIEADAGIDPDELVCAHQPAAGAQEDAEVLAALGV
jgi:hypothetical protein